MFTDALEKQIINTYETAFSYSQPLSKTSTMVGTFFRANKKVCEDWFARIRQALVRASVACGSYTDIIKHSTHRINDIKAILRDTAPSSKVQLNIDLEYCIIQLTRATCELRDADALEGLVALVSNMGDII